MKRIAGLQSAVLLTGFCVLVANMTLAESCLADVVYLQDGRVLFGRIIDQQADSIVFDERPGNSATYRRKTIRRSDVATLVVNIQPDQLKNLRPDHPAGYFNLAEELATQKRDPEARDLAIRLFLLGAKYGQPSIQQGCFAGATELARSPVEEERFRALASVNLNDDRDWLVPSGQSVINNSDAEASNNQRRKQLQESLRLLRNGQRSEAAKRIAEDWVQETMVSFERICTWQQLRTWSSEPELKIHWLARVLELEIALNQSPKPGVSNSSDSRDWSELAGRSNHVEAVIDFANVSEFNLDLPLYRDGKWVAVE